MSESIDRKTLYGLVWSEPISTLAERFGPTWGFPSCASAMAFPFPPEDIGRRSRQAGRFDSLRFPRLRQGSTTLN